MFKSGCCGGTNGGVVEMEKQDKESQEKDKGKGEVTSYKFMCFNETLDAEAIRFIFQVAGVSFEDIRVDKDDWDDVKKGLKWGKLPVLEVDEISIYSSTAIGRLLGRRFQLVGKGDLESAQCDEYVEVCQELETAWKTFFDEEDESKKSEAKEHLKGTTFHEFLPKLNQRIEENSKNGGYWLVGDSCTWADLFLTNLLEIFEDTIDSDFLAEYPALQKLKEAVFTIPEMKQYAENRS